MGPPRAEASVARRLPIRAGDGMGMMIFGGLAALLGLGLLASLIVLVWVVIGRLRRDTRPMAG
jgi:hypothetical protein